MLLLLTLSIPQVLVSLSNTANTRFEVDVQVIPTQLYLDLGQVNVQGSTNLKLHVTSNLAVKSPIKVTRKMLKKTKKKI